MGLNRVSFFLCVLLCACNGAQEAQHIRETLDGVETYLASRPDSVLTVLRNLDPDALKTKKDRAWAALLHSIALDKCYVDITSDSILAPALAYYRHHGTADQRLKARYYRAVLARNTGDRDTQMAWLVEAERFIPRAHDPEMAGFIYAAKRQLYLDLLDVNNALIHAREAVSVYESAGLWPRYYNAVLSLAGILQMQSQYEEARRWIDTLKQHADLLTPAQLNSLYAVQVNQDDSIARGSLPIVIDEYLNAGLSEASIHWLSIAEACTRTGNMGQAAEALDHYRSTAQYDTTAPVFWLVSHRLYQASGDYELSAFCYKRYDELMYDRRQRAIVSEARFVPERKKNHVSTIRDRFILAGSIFLGLLLLGYLISVLANRRKQRIALETEIEEQREKLRAIQKEIKQEKRKEKEYRALISKSLHLDNKDFWESAIHTDKSSMLRLEASFSLAYPEFVETIRKKGLKKQERLYCYLAILGFKNKEFPSLLGHTSILSVYNLSSRVRQKLGIHDKDVALAEYLKETLWLSP